MMKSHVGRIVSRLSALRGQHGHGNRGVYDKTTQRVFNIDTHRLVPKGTSVYDPDVYGKYDLSTQFPVPKDEADRHPYNFDSILQYAQRYRKNADPYPLQTNRIKVTADYVPQGHDEGGMLLDACTSRPIEPIQEAAERGGYRYQPIDIYGDGKKALKEDLRSLSFDDGSIAAVVSIDTLEHIEELDQALSEIHRVLKEDGIFVVHVPCYYFDKPESAPIDATNDPRGHVRYFSGPDLVNRMFERGFIPLKVGNHLDYGSIVVSAAKRTELWKGR